MISEAKLERVERTMWELEQLASELYDLGYIRQANMVFEAVDEMTAELEDFDGSTVDVA